MLAFIRYLMKLKDHEHVLRTKYHKSHPHFYTYLAVDALLSMGLVFGALQIASSMAGASETQIALTHAGGRALDAADLVAHVPLPFHHGSRYWLGPLAGYSYTTNCITPGVLIVTYLNPGQKLDDAAAPFMTITAYETQADMTKGLHGVVDHLNTTTENLRGDLLIYDATLMNKLTISRAQSKEVVVIEYSTSQNLNSMIYDSENLVPLT